METEVYCTLQIEGLHYWRDCPLPEVDYLRYPHRHVFHIKAHKPVHHDDRDVEFICLKHQIRNYLRLQYYDTQTKICDFGGQSCEMIAKELIEQFDLTRVDVSEDGENGSVVTNT